MGGFDDVLFAGTYFEFGPSAGIVVSKDNGETWTSANNGLPGAGIYTSKANCFLGFDNIILTSWRNDGLFLSNDTGSTWQHCLNGIPATPISALTMYVGIIYAMNNSGQIYSSSDSAQTWSLFSSIPFTSISMSYSDIQFRDSIIYVTTSGNLGICISYDFGQTWGTSNIGLTCLNIWSMAIKDSMIALGTQPCGLFLSNNYGMNWSHVNLGPTSPWITSLAIANDTLFAGTLFSEGIMVSADWGNTWSALNDGLYSNINILGIQQFYANEDYLYVSIGTSLSRFSIYKRPINQITNQPELPLIRNELEIHPNPNKGNFTILAPASVFGNEPVIVSVFDISGRIIFKKSINTDEEFISDELIGKRGLFTCTVTSSKITRNKRVVVY